MVVHVIASRFVSCRTITRSGIVVCLDMVRGNIVYRRIIGISS